MARGYVSDVNGSDAVMDSPTATVSIDPSEIPPNQALALIREADAGEHNAYDLGELLQGEDSTQELNDIEFHLTLQQVLVALDHIDVVDLPDEPPSVEEQV
jgi:hypothetical protein